jgi:DNA topoisomerase-3
MDIAEKLYNRGYISYPRTETNSFPKTLNLKDLIGNFIHIYKFLE